MKLPLLWLQDILKTKLNAEKLAEFLMYKSLEVERAENPAVGLDKIIVARILDVRQHPNADKLRLAICEVASGRRIEVVCGGSNLKKGMKVAFARVGAKVRWHGEGELVELQPAEIRGVKSEGMICASTEIGLGEIFPLKDSHEILDLSWLSAPPGTPLAEALGLGPVLELAILPNRPDLLSIYGLAREVAALLGKKLPAMPKFQLREIASEPLKNYLSSVKIEDKKNCLQYGARVITGVKVGESPEWLKKRLIQVGMNPINNIVDITNFVLMELGQPLHAFDGEKLAGKTIVVRPASAGAKFIALDSNEYVHDPAMLVIADAERAVAIAGVMGGKEAGITETTRTVILESAIFNPASIRKTARKLSLHSESSLRFERGIDPALQEIALDYAVALTAEICGGKIAAGKIIIGNIKSSPVKIKVSRSYLKKILGAAVPLAQIKSILKSLGCKVPGASTLIVTPPSWRQDLRWPADIAEEVGRIYGYDKLGEQYLSGMFQPAKIDAPLQLADIMRDKMARMGFDEVMNYSFYGEREMKLSEWPHLELRNPMNPDERFMRTNLSARLSALAAEIKRRGEEAKIFEIGKVFLPSDDILPREELHLAAVVVSKKSVDQNFMEIKGALENLRVDGLANVFSEFAVFEVDLSRAAAEYSDRIKFKSLPEFPAVERDLAMIFDENNKWQDIHDVIKTEGGELLHSIYAFDIYRGKEISDGKKSIAFRMIFFAPNRTLRVEEVDKLIEKIKSALAAKFGAMAR